MFNQYSPIIPQTTGLFRRGISFSNFLSNTQKTLNIVNQAIPIVYQVRPIFKNAKTMFRVAKEFSRPNNNTKNIVEENNEINNIFYTNDNNGLSFFI